MTENSKSASDASLPKIVTTELKSSEAAKSGGSWFDAAKRSFQTSADATRAAAVTAGHGMTSAAEAMKKVAGTTAKAAGDFGSVAYHAVGDLNGDGKVDEEDWKIARAAAGKAASVVGREAGELGKAVARHDIVKDAAAGAAVGALIAIPIPIIGPPTGAAIGGAIGMVRGVVGSGVIGDVLGQVAAGARKPAPRKTTRRKKPAA